MEIDLKNKFFLIAGPCVIEGRDITRKIASEVVEKCAKYSIPCIFKASYRKANRSRKDSFTGIGDMAALEILQEIREDFNIPILTDIHSVLEASLASSFSADILQIPAFLSRQTDILEAAAQTGRFVNIKKGQFLSPSAMKYAIEKVESTGNNQIMITERGTQFGYSDLVVDFRGIPTMKSFGYPVIMDITHSLQEPNQACGVTGGKPELISTLARAAVATGVDGLFLETHPNPSQAKSDGANMLPLNQLEGLIKEIVAIRQAYESIHI